jgi:hypothetical protein
MFVGLPVMPIAFEPTRQSWLASGLIVATVQRETATIPIVFFIGVDPIDSGFVSNLARPGANITGFTTFEPEMGGKWLELLKDIAFLETFTERGHIARSDFRSPRVEKHDNWHRRLLRARCERPRRRRAAEQRDELASSYVEHGLPSGTRCASLPQAQDAPKAPRRSLG